MVSKAIRNADPQVPCCMVKATLLEAQSTHVNRGTYRKALETGIHHRALVYSCDQGNSPKMVGPPMRRLKDEWAT